MKIKAFDVETRGVQTGYALQPFRAEAGDAWLTMFATADERGEDGFVFNYADPDIRRIEMVARLGKFLTECAETKTTIAAWNAPFDAAWAIALGLRELVYANKWIDGQLLWKHLTQAPEWSAPAKSSYGLKAAVAEFYPDEAGYETDIDFNTDDPEEIQRLFEYNKKDAMFTHRLVLKFFSELNEKQKRNALFEAACIPMVAESIVEGVRINLDAATELEAKLIDDANLAFVKLKLATTDESVTPDVLASPTKLRHLLYDTWGLKPPKMTRKGADSTDRDALNTLADTDPRAALLNDYREAKNNCTKFATGAINSVNYNGDGFSRPLARIYGTYTGRMSYTASTLRGKDKCATGIPLHQWKRAPEFREIVQAPEGYTLLEFDFSGQEFRWMAVLTNDDTMLKLCADGEDAHAYMGGRVANIPYSEMLRRKELKDKEVLDFRQLGKVANLSLQYRTSAATLRNVSRVSYGLRMTEMEAKAIHATYRTAYPGVVQYWKRQAQLVSSTGWVETVAGRQINVGTPDTWRRWNEKTDQVDDWTWASESTSINFPIQGTGADQKYLALAVLKNYLPQVDGRFYFELHDGLFVVVPDRYVGKAVEDIRNMLSNLPYKQAWGVDLPIKFPVDAKSGKSWGQLKEIK